MFEERYSLHIGNPIKKITTQLYGEKVALLYKVKTTKKKSYIIRVDEYEDNVFFIKFYLSKYETNPDKYKYRNPKHYREDFTRLVITCITLAKRILKNNPDSVLAFHGQWDNLDIEKESVTSQRFNLYKRVMISKAPKDKYEHIEILQLNSYAIIPREFYSKERVDQIYDRFISIFGEDGLEELAIPEK